MSLDFFSLLHLKTSTIPKTDVMTKEFDRRSWFSSVVFGYTLTETVKHLQIHI